MNYEITQDCRINSKEYKKGEIVTKDEVGGVYTSCMQKTDKAPKTPKADKAPKADKVSEDGSKALVDHTINELKALAEEQGIDLGNATKKADIVAVIEAAQSATDSDGSEGGDAQ